MAAGKFFGGNVSRRSERVDGGVALVIVMAGLLLSGFSVASANNDPAPVPVETSLTETVSVGGSAGFTVSGSAGLTQ